MRNLDKYEAYNQKGHDSFAGDWEQFVLTFKEGEQVVLGHFWTWSDPSVQHEWNPTQDGFAGRKWPTARPKGFRKIRAGLKRDQTLDWMLDCLLDWAG